MATGQHSQITDNTDEDDRPRRGSIHPRSSLTNRQSTPQLTLAFCPPSNPLNSEVSYGSSDETQSVTMSASSNANTSPSSATDDLLPVRVESSWLSRSVVTSALLGLTPTRPIPVDSPPLVNAENHDFDSYSSMSKRPDPPSDLDDYKYVQQWAQESSKMERVDMNEFSGQDSKDGAIFKGKWSEPHKPVAVGLPTRTTSERSRTIEAILKADTDQIEVVAPAQFSRQIAYGQPTQNDHDIRNHGRLIGNRLTSLSRNQQRGLPSLPGAYSMNPAPLLQTSSSAATSRSISSSFGEFSSQNPADTDLNSHGDRDHDDSENVSQTAASHFTGLSSLSSSSRSSVSMARGGLSSQPSALATPPLGSGGEVEALEATLVEEDQELIRLQILERNAELQREIERLRHDAYGPRISGAASSYSLGDGTRIGYGPPRDPFGDRNDDREDEQTIQDATVVAVSVALSSLSSSVPMLRPAAVENVDNDAQSSRAGKNIRKGYLFLLLLVFLAFAAATAAVIYSVKQTNQATIVNTSANVVLTNSSVPINPPETTPSRSPWQSPTTPPLPLKISESPSQTIAQISPSPSQTVAQTGRPSDEPSLLPSDEPSLLPSMNYNATHFPSTVRSSEPSAIPTRSQSAQPSSSNNIFEPFSSPSSKPSRSPSVAIPVPTTATPPTGSGPVSPPSARKPTPRPTKRPTPRPVAPNPVVRPTRKPTRKPTPRPIPIPVAKPIPIPVAKPVPKPTRKPTPRPVPQPVPKPVPKPTPKPTPRPIPPPVPKPVPKPTRKPTPRPVPKPVPKPVPAPVPAPVPTTPICFSSYQELRSAVDDYLKNPVSTSTVAQTYGWPIGSWCVGAVDDMSYLFATNRNSEAASFNQDLSRWDTGSAVDMSHMFSGAAAFNQDLSSWDVSRVTDMDYMFGSAARFNQNLARWDVSRINSMWRMFWQASSFNQNLCAWGTKVSSSGRVSANQMFVDTSCPMASTSADLSASPPGPFCYACS